MTTARIARMDSVRAESGLFASMMINAAMPHFAAMHEMTVDHAHEEIQLLALTFSTMLFETMAVMPSWRDWYKSTDQSPTYRYLETVLKVLRVSSRIVRSRPIDLSKTYSTEFVDAAR